MTAARKTYDRIAPIYDILDSPYELTWKRRLRARVFQGLAGDVLDAGAGTGCNIVAYPPSARVTAVDASGAMLAQARARAARLRRDVEFRRMDLAKLDLPNERFDAVVATFVFMCIPENAQLAALAELARVCRMNGEIRLVDYRLSDRPLVRAGMRVMSPWLKFAFAGTYAAGVDRHFDEVGLACVDQVALVGDIVTMSVLRRC
ncbi:MAG: class I SAM-dependent methyltransferase [Hyphomicrobiales bacterium]|nr:class I SAM-dependent methyltransferase [Hyphomicrobiales bacterium]